MIFSFSFDAIKTFIASGILHFQFFESVLMGYRDIGGTPLCSGCVRFVGILHLVVVLLLCFESEAHQFTRLFESRKG